MFRLLHALCLVLVTTVSLAAQTFAGLVADSVTYDADTRELLAKGNVVVSYDGTLIEAASISYNSSTGLLRAVGPLRLTTPDGTVTLASLAELSDDLQTGLIQGAQVLLSNNFQISTPLSKWVRIYSSAIALVVVVVIPVKTFLPLKIQVADILAQPLQGRQILAWIELTRTMERITVNSEFLV